MYARGGPRPQPGTLNQLFFDAVEKYDKPDALQVAVGEQYEPISHARRWPSASDDVRSGSRSSASDSGDRVAILSENRPEWAIADYACLTAGVTDVPLYPNLPAEQIAYILRDSGAVAIFVSTRSAGGEDRGRFGARCPRCKHVIGFAAPRRRAPT